MYNVLYIELYLCTFNCLFSLGIMPYYRSLTIWSLTATLVVVPHR